MTISIDPRVFGSPLLTWPALAIGVGVALLVTFLVWRAPTLGASRTQVYGLASLTVVGGLIGARIAHVFDYAGYYATVPFQIAYVWNGGFAAWGALLGSMGVLAWRAPREVPDSHQLWAMLLPLGVALLGVLRAVDFLTGQRPGVETSLPWGVVYQHPNAAAYLPGVTQHPVALYELVWIFAVAAVVVLLARPMSWPGRSLSALVHQGVMARVLAALSMYALGRFMIGFATAGQVHAGLLQSQWIALAVLIGIGARIILARRRHTRAKQATVRESPAGVR